MHLFYKDYGHGTPLVILHGLLGASGNWHTLSRNIFSEQYRVYALDQRNHGRSPHSDRFDYEVMVGDLRQFMDEEGIQSAHLLGHSMGGKTAMHFATQYPGRVKKLIVADIAPREYPGRHDEILDALAAVDPARFEDRNDIDAALAEHIDSKPIRLFLMKNLTLDREAKQYRWQMNLPAIRANYDRINQALPADARFEGPTLFIRGARSDYITDEDRDLIRRHFPKATVVTLKDAGHWLHADQPEAFAETVMVFLGAE